MSRVDTVVKKSTANALTAVVKHAGEMHMSVAITPHAFVTPVAIRHVMARVDLSSFER